MLRLICSQHDGMKAEVSLRYEMAYGRMCASSNTFNLFFNFVCLSSGEVGVMS